MEMTYVEFKKIKKIQVFLLCPYFTEDNIEDWDQAKLEQVINSKHDNKSKQTAIVRFF